MPWTFFNRWFVKPRRGIKTTPYRINANPPWEPGFWDHARALGRVLGRAFMPIIYAGIGSVLTCLMLRPTKTPAPQSQSSPHVQEVSLPPPYVPACLSLRATVRVCRVDDSVAMCTYTRVYTETWYYGPLLTSSDPVQPVPWIYDY